MGGDLRRASVRGRAWRRVCARARAKRRVARVKIRGVEGVVVVVVVVVAAR